MVNYEDLRVSREEEDLGLTVPRVFGNGLERIEPDMDDCSELVPSDEEKARLGDRVIVCGILLTSLYSGAAAASKYFSGDLDDARSLALGAFGLAALAAGAFAVYKHVHRE